MVQARQLGNAQASALRGTVNILCHSGGSLSLLELFPKGAGLRE